MAKMSGGKFTGSHTTVIDAAVEILKALNTSEQVTKIAIGYIKQKVGKSASQPRYKIQDNGAGIRLTVNGPATIQEFHVYTEDPDATRLIIAANWPYKNGKGKKRRKKEKVKQ